MSAKAMNPSFSANLSRSGNISSHGISTVDHITLSLGWDIVSFLLASAFAALLGSRNAIWYGVLNTSLRAWQGSGSMSSGATALFGLLILLVNKFTSKSRISARCDNRHPDDNANQMTEEDLPKDLYISTPLIYPSRTTHRRLYPRSHAFNYTYLLVGIPVSRRPVNANSMVSVHPPTTSHQDDTTAYSPNGTSWFSVHASDYLQRGSSFHHLTLREKVNLYLTSQEISNPEATYPYAYLVTAPRFLGFSFNPVSFWYLYDAQQQLTAMILEVNNTFDERRMYFLRNDDDEEQSSNESDGAKPANDTPSKSPSKRFTSKWRKDFHVSPFNDRDGTYSVNAVDIQRTGSVDVTIVLSSVADTTETPTDSTTSTTSIHSDVQTHPRTKPKLFARIYSSTSFYPTASSTLHRFLFLLRHGFIGFLTNLRILIEARKLWWEKGLTVFYRPEPLDTAVPRVETAEEVVIEERFRAVLDEDEKREGIQVEYVSAAGAKRSVLVRLGQVVRNEDGHDHGECDLGGRKRDLKIHVLTPAFYSELAMVDGGNGSLQESFKRLCFNAEPKEKMIDCSSSELLHTILADTPSLKEHKNTSATSKCSGLESITSRIVQNLVSRLRSSRSQGLLSIFRPTHESSTSTFDKQVRNLSTTDQYTAYLHSVLTILLADKLALGSVALLRFEFRLLRLPLVVVLTTTVMKIVSHLFQVRHGSAANLSQP